MGTLLHQIDKPHTLSLQKKPGPFRKWTKNDILTLRRLANDFSTLKDMARHMDRTPASINTALDRYGLRVRKYIKATRTKGPSPSRSSQPKAPLRQIRPLQPDLTIYTHLEQTIQWLRENGTTALPTTYRLSNHPQLQLYYINGQLMPAYGLVIEANKQRLLRKLPVFHVHEITE